MKTAVVTGANKGIGQEVARQLAAKGFRVFVGARDEKAGRAAAREIGRAATFLKLDVANPQSIRDVANQVGQLNDRLDVLVNNAAIALDGDESVLRIRAEVFEETLRTNALGPLLVAQAFELLLSKSDAPRIVNVSSGSGQLTGGADGWAPAYAISKTALNGVTSQLAAALPRFAVNAVCPGWVRTEMGGENATRSVQEGAAGIVWLASDAPQTLTGKFVRDQKTIPW